MTQFVEKLVFDDVPRFVEHSIEQGIRIGLDVLTSGAVRPPAAIAAGRPVTSISVPTAFRARRLAYAADVAGRAEAGEVVWTFVVYPDNPDRGEDRPVLVVGRDHGTLLGLLLSTEAHPDEPNWVGVGSGSWAENGRASWVRLDRVLDVSEEGIRREGAILSEGVFEAVAARLRAEYSWG